MIFSNYPFISLHEVTEWLNEGVYSPINSIYYKQR